MCESGSDDDDDMQFPAVLENEIFGGIWHPKCYYYYVLFNKLIAKDEDFGRPTRNRNFGE